MSYPYFSLWSCDSVLLNIYKDNMSFILKKDYYLKIYKDMLDYL